MGIAMTLMFTIYAAAVIALHLRLIQQKSMIKYLQIRSSMMILASVLEVSIMGESRTIIKYKDIPKTHS